MPASNGQMTLRRRSRVVHQPIKNSGNVDNIILHMASVADAFPAWGTDWRNRDKALRAFLPTEPILETAYYSTVSRYSALGWGVRGPLRMATMSRNFLHNAQFGQGWLSFILRVTQDLYSTDNGGFIEINRERETDPPAGINHLDSGRCYRTGRDEDPVHYIDLEGREHELKWFQVVPMADFPSPIETAKGAQVCAISRVFRAAQVMRDINTYKHQKISGKNVPAIHVIGGVSPGAVKKAVEDHQLQQEQAGNSVYTEAMILTGYSPDATVSSTTIEMASLPDGFNEEVAMRMYLIIVCNAFGIDYQDLAPLPGGNLGSGHQSDTLDRKSKEKGPRIFMQLMEHALNFHGILPNSVTFKYGEQDSVQELEQARLALSRAQERKLRIESLEITPAIAAQRALDVGDLTREEFLSMGYTDLTDDVTLYSAKEMSAEKSFWDKLWAEPAIWQPHYQVVPDVFVRG